MERPGEQGNRRKNKAICRKSWHRTTATNQALLPSILTSEPNKGLQNTLAASWEQLKPNQVQNTLFFYVKREEKRHKVESILKGTHLLVLSFIWVAVQGHGLG